MLRTAFAALLLVTPALAAAQAEEDPYLWLEDIEGERALEQVEQWNARTEADLAATPGFDEHRARALALLNDENQIAAPDEIQGDHVTNFWIDGEHPRGLWRISPLDAYLDGTPEWRVLIDVGALGDEEGTSWVWHGANCLAPDYTRCLVSLSPGGGDADVTREFDVAAGAFVEDGFMIPEAKHSVTWLDANRLVVATDYGEGSMTNSGYARIAKIWERGTPLSEAQTLFEGTAENIGVGPFAAVDGDRRWVFLSRSLTFWTSEVLLVGPDGLQRVPMPETASEQDVFDGQLIVRLNEALETESGVLPSGALVAYDLTAIAAGEEPAPSLVMAPNESQAIEEVAVSGGVLWVKALDDVSGRLFALRRAEDGSWTQEAMALPDNATIHIAATGDDIALATVEGMLMPPSLYAVHEDGRVADVQSLPAQFDASAMTVEQRFATSADGTRIPYFLVRPRDVEGPVPTFIHAYGGFRAAQTPTYLTQQPYRSGPLGLFWVEAGNAYVLANIRGGGEYGPAWHEAALRENRQRSFDDLAAVGEDLIATGVTSAGHLGISGRSNGGVLVGAAANQRPDLYSAVISGSPLTDMQRYSHLLAGASWMGEYGNPDVPEDWAFMRLYSPYQNLRAVEGYPATFYYLSTLDDRVHPGHARKMAVRHQELGQTFYFREYREGGHSVGADRTEDAMRAALLYAFLNRELGAE
ncbi:prolyl oligopeptidase family serine peptidase [Parasphingopyxis marina]|uniref:S9 family peptidase n=1 Tax=Parasphingopyxis marina TaxID=2761622 RepID=A0A842I0I2_9SPHN|nr:prolyl oligopeptidase family serine peptidase [Parasphingopyxis marina]MBC2777264.1 S9 family peptidase [Parasphingopyxis marina]